MRSLTVVCIAQEVGGTLIGEDRLVVMAEAELVEWYQIHGLLPFHSLHSSHYYEPSSPQQPPLMYSTMHFALHAGGTLLAQPVSS